MSRILVSVILIMGALLLAALIAGDAVTSQITSAASLQSVALLLGYLALVSGVFITAVRTQGWTVLRYFAIWLAIACLIALVYRLMH